MRSPLILENLAWPDVAALREKNGGLLLLPMGATEQHGPHLPIAMDSLLVEKTCHEISARTGVPVLSTLRFTVSQGHTAKWPGTFSITHPTFIATLNELADWAAATGWQRLLFINSHFGNDASARVAIDQIRLRLLGRLQIGLINIFNLTPEIWKQYTVDAEDLHANKAETELMMHLFPDLVHMDRLDESDDFDRTIGTVFSHPVSQTSMNGVTGFPSHATAKSGALLFDHICTALEAAVRQAVIEQPPLSPEDWENIRHPHHPR